MGLGSAYSGLGIGYFDLDWDDFGKFGHFLSSGCKCFDMVYCSYSGCNWDSLVDFSYPLHCKIDHSLVQPDLPLLYKIGNSWFRDHYRYK